MTWCTACNRAHGERPCPKAKKTVSKAAAAPSKEEAKKAAAAAAAAAEEAAAAAAAEEERTRVTPENCILLPQEDLCCTPTVVIGVDISGLACETCRQVPGLVR